MKKPQRNPLHGWVNLYKPLHITSADAVFQVKRLIHPTKIGHAGTLDPLATGVLPLALGEGTKCVNLLMDAKKTYEFSVTFGQRRSTDDAEGEVVTTSEHIPSEAQIRGILPLFTGEIMQTPPIYSALKIAGKRAYDMARAGEEVWAYSAVQARNKVKRRACSIKNGAAAPWVTTACTAFSRPSTSESRLRGRFAKVGPV
jgi:tRNA pseudouridine55 synthase